MANRLVSRNARPKVLGIPIPDELNPSRLDAGTLAKHVDVKRMAKNVDVKRITKKLDVKDLVRHIGDIAEQVEAHSEEVRTLSGQAKRLSRRIS